MSDKSHDTVVQEARALAERASRASLYPANELILIAKLLELLSLRSK